MKESPPIPPTRTEHDRFVDKIVTLKETIDELQERNNRLEAEREELLEENRSLRRKITQVRLLDGFKDSIESIKAETGGSPPAPPPAEDLYHLLPPSFSFAEFFRIADSEGVDTDAARHCLLHFLAEDLVVQEGSRLVRQKETSPQ